MQGDQGYSNSPGFDALISAALGQNPEGLPGYLSILQQGVAYHSGTAVPMPHTVGAVFGGGLLVPQDAITSAIDYFGVFLTLEDYVELGPPGLDKSLMQQGAIEAILASCEKAEMLGSLAGLAAALIAEPMRERLREEFRSILAPKVQARFDGAFAGGGAPRVFLARQPVLAAFRTVLASETPDSPTNQFPAPLAAILLVHAVASTLHDSSVEDAEPAPAIAGLPAPLAIDLVCNQAFYESDDVYSLLDRQVRLWRDYGDAGAEHLQGRQPADVLQALTGLEIEDILALGFGLFAHVMAWEPGKPIRANEGFGSQMDSGLIDAFLELVSRTPGEMAQAVATPRRSLWDFLAFQEHPVLHIDDGLLVVDAAMLLERVTTGLYWVMHDRIRDAEGDGARDRWTHAWAAMVEALAEDELRPQSPTLLNGASTFFTEDDIGQAYPGSKTADAAIDFGSAFVAVEIVSGQLKTETRIDGDPHAFAADMERIAYKKIRQLDATAKNLLKRPEALIGQTSSVTAAVYPVVIAAGGLPLSPVTTALIHEYCGENNLLDLPLIEPVAVMDLGELEMLEGMLARGMNMVTVLKGWQESNLAHMSIRNYLLDAYPGYYESFRPARMHDRVDALFEEIRKRLKLADDPDFGSSA